MEIEELIEWRANFKTVVYWKGQILCRNNDIKALTRYDKNGSHNTAILKAIGYRDEAKKIFNEKLKGFEYEYMMLSIRKATALYNSGKRKSDLRKFIEFKPFELKNNCSNCQGCGCTTCGGSGFM